MKNSRMKNSRMQNYQMKSSRNTQTEPFSSNAIRLSVREWLTAVAIVVVIAVALPEVWKSIETFVPSADYRIPYELSEDYWLYSQYCRSVCDQDNTLVIGDSVIWGQYVSQDQTLTHHLNELAGAERFVNLGLDGTHPMALAGLIKYHGREIRGEDVVLHLNLLWLSSPEADLQTEKEFRFNHPRLVPQFGQRIPCYTESISGRINILVERKIAILKWTRHLQSVYFGGTNLQQWTVENPYSNPLSRISFRLPEASDAKYPNAESWLSQGRSQQTLPWVEPETSLQWGAFQRLARVLVSRGNRVQIIVGPLNEHMLDPDSVSTYRQILEKIETSLKKMNLDYSLLPLLPSHLYADTSHPLGEGYALLAEQILSMMTRLE